MTFKEFTGKNVEEAIRSAMKEFTADLSELDIEILSQGSRGILGVGGEEARILAAPKSAVEAAETVRFSADEAEAEAPAPAAPAAAAGSAAPPAPVGEAADAAPDELAAGEAGVAAATGPVAFDTEAVEAAPSEIPEAPRRRGTRGRGGRTREGGRGREAGGRGRQREAAEPRGVREARTDRSGREPAPFVPAKPLEELSEKERSVLEEAKAVLEELLRLMDLPGSVEIAMGTETAKLNVVGDDLGVLIGRRGEKLASLQHIVNLIVARREGQHNRIAVDVENYRGRREEQLRDVATRAAKRVIQSGKIIQLEPMPAIERRIVHLALVENPRIRTQSVGVEPNRRIVVLPAGQLPE